MSSCNCPLHDKLETAREFAPMEVWMRCPSQGKDSLMRQTRLIFVLTAALTAFAALALAQSSDSLRAVEGTVQDSSGAPVNGAIVQLKDTKTLQIRSFITRDNGAFVFQGIKKSVEYELKAKFKNKESKARLLTIFDDRQRANIDLKIED